MGVPLTGDKVGNSQTTGLGRGLATSNKVFFVESEVADGRLRLISTLAQLSANHAEIDWSVNCGNMSAALPLWALDSGLISPPPGPVEIDIRNTNTGVVTTSRMARDAAGLFSMAEIPGRRWSLSQRGSLPARSSRQKDRAAVAYGPSVRAHRGTHGIMRGCCGAYGDRGGL